MYKNGMIQMSFQIDTEKDVVFAIFNLPIR